MAQPFNYASIEDERRLQLNADQDVEEGPSTSSLPNFESQLSYAETHDDLGTHYNITIPETGDYEEPEPEDEPWSNVPEKPMAEFASQKFKRKPKESDKKRPSKKSRTAGIAEKSAENTGDEVEEEDLDEAETAETEEFYSQLIDLNAIGAANPDQPARARLIQRQRPRWHISELEFFGKCVELYDINYGMIQEFLPHRSIPEIKKQHDKQRALFPILFASYATEPRFSSVAEYREKRRALIDDLAKLQEDMQGLGIKAWMDGVTKRILPTEEEEDEAFYCLEHPELMLTSGSNEENGENSSTDQPEVAEEEEDDSMDQYLFQLRDSAFVEE